MQHHKKGDSIIDRQNRKFLLLHYYGEFVSKNGTRQFKLKLPTPEGKDYVKFEVWECINQLTGMKDILKVPVYIYGEVIDTVEYERKDVIDDNNEVTSLLDSYSCWEKYVKTGVSERDRKNWHLTKVNKEHRDQIFRLRNLEKLVKSTDFKKGVRLKLIQKENPDHYVRKEFKLWKESFPLLFTKLKDYVYQNIDIFDTSYELYNSKGE